MDTNHQLTFSECVLQVRLRMSKPIIGLDNII
jgi:hypothetical protein